MRKHLSQAGLLLLSVGLVYPCAFLYDQNAGEARAVEALLFFGIFTALARLWRVPLAHPETWPPCMEEEPHG